LEGGTAHRRAQGRENKSPWGRGSTIQRGEGEIDGGNSEGVGSAMKRLDLGLQDTPRSLIYRDQKNRQKGKHNTMASRNSMKRKSTQQSQRSGWQILLISGP